jgi:hypothetical protein
VRETISALALVVSVAGCAASGAAAQPPGASSTTIGGSTGGEAAAAPAPTCAPLPAIPEVDPGTTYGSRVAAAGKLLLAARFEPLPGPDAAGRDARVAWMQSCGASWLTWRRNAVARADTLLRAAFDVTRLRPERADAVVAAARGWIELVEAIERVWRAAEPSESLLDSNAHQAFDTSLAKDFFDQHVEPMLATCRTVAQGLPERPACDELEERGLAATKHDRH